MEIKAQVLQKLTEIGLVAAGRGMLSEAETIFAALEAVRPESEIPLVGRAIAHLNRNSTAAAVRLLEQALSKNADSQIAKTFLGVANLSAGMNAAAETQLQQAIEVDPHSDSATLAKALLQTPTNA